MIFDDLVRFGNKLTVFLPTRVYRTYDDVIKSQKAIEIFSGFVRVYDIYIYILTGKSRSWFKIFRLYGRFLVQFSVLSIPFQRRQ